MRKTKARKLTLLRTTVYTPSAQTIQVLAPAQLATVIGGGSGIQTMGASCWGGC
jgi:hypothetical protein